MHDPQALPADPEDTGPGDAGPEDLVIRDAAHGAGSRTWYFPDGDRPPAGPDGGPEAHESLMILNVCARPATVDLDLYWTDRPPVLGIRVVVPGERVRGLRVPWHDDPADAGRSAIPVREQYALRVRSDIPVICQYGRLEAVPSFALYTTMGFTR
ncbi:MAG TPA: sensory rhodopsin transducer [Streptosporangiaceae bacterium]